MIGNKLYDSLRFLAQILLPALGTLYAALAAIYNWGHVEEVGGTVLAVDTFLGVLVSYLKLKYDASDEKFDGQINVEETPDGQKVVGMQLHNFEDPNDVVNADTLLFKVNKPA